MPTNRTRGQRHPTPVLAITSTTTGQTPLVIGRFASTAGAVLYLGEVIALADPRGVAAGRYTIGPGVAFAAATITFSMSIQNVYEYDDSLDTRVVDALIPAPPPGPGSDAYRDWQGEFITCRSGVGHTRGDAFYAMTITACSDPALVGVTFSAGT